MNKNHKQLFLTTTIPIIICLMLSFIKQGFLIISFLNNLFLFSLILLILGCTLFVIQSGVFNGIIYSYLRFYKKTSKVGKYLVDLEGESENLIEPFDFSLSKPLLLAGGLLFFLSLVGSFFIYF